MNSLTVLARKEFKSAFKDRVFFLIAILFIIMSIASVYIGSTTKNAEMQAYESILSVAKAQGGNIPSAPEIYPLAILRNIIDYIVMIGAVLAVFLGFDAFSGERENGTLSLLLTRPLYRDQVVTGKIIGAGMTIGTLLSVTLIFNIILFSFATRMMPGMNEVFRLAAFIILAFIYMMLFYIGALLLSIKTRDRAYGFLTMMVAWVFVSYVIPQLADTQRNFAYAITGSSGVVSQIPADTAISKAIELFSPAVQFKHIGNDLLQVVSQTATINISHIIANDILPLIYILIPVIVLLTLAYIAVQKEDVL